MTVNAFKSDLTGKETDSPTYISTNLIIQFVMF